MSNITLGRTETAYLTNKSGGALAYGDVCVIDTANQLAMTTTTVIGFLDGKIGVVLEPNGIANNASGLFAFSGYVPQINLDAAATVGQLLKTCATAKLATPHSAPLVEGDFAQALTAGATPQAIMFGISLPVASVNAPDYIQIRNEQTQGTDGGTFTSGAWRTRTLNTEVSDDGSHAALSSNQITLEAGTYEVLITVPAYEVGGHQARLYNISDSAVALLGTTERSGTADFVSTNSKITGKFTIASAKIFEVQHLCQTTKATVGFGAAGNLSTEIYTVFEARKVG